MLRLTSFTNTELKFTDVLEGVFLSGEPCRILLLNAVAAFLRFSGEFTPRLARSCPGDGSPWLVCTASLMPTEQVFPAFLLRHHMYHVSRAAVSQVLKGLLAAVGTNTCLFRPAAL